MNTIVNDTLLGLANGYQRWKNPIDSQFHNGMQTKNAFFSSQQGEGEGALGWDYDKLLSWKHGHVKLHQKKIEGE